VWVLGIIHSPTKRFLRNARRPRWLRPLGTPEKKGKVVSCPSHDSTKSLPASRKRFRAVFSRL